MRLQSPWSPCLADLAVKTTPCLCSLLRPPLAPRSGCRQATPKLHTTLGQSCPPSEAKSTFHKTGPHPQVGSQPLIWKKRGLLVLSRSKVTSTPHLVLPHSLPVLYDFRDLKGPQSTVSSNCCSATQAGTLPPCRPVKLVPSWTSSAPMPADSRDSLVLKVAGSVWIVKGALEAAFHTTTVPKSSLLYTERRFSSHPHPSGCL